MAVIKIIAIKIACSEHLLIFKGGNFPIILSFLPENKPRFDCIFLHLILLFRTTFAIMVTESSLLHFIIVCTNQRAQTYVCIYKHWVVKISWPLFTENYIHKIGLRVHLVYQKYMLCDDSEFYCVTMFCVIRYFVATNTVYQPPGTSIAQKQFSSSIALFVRYVFGLGAILWGHETFVYEKSQESYIIRHKFLIYSNLSPSKSLRSLLPHK